MVNRERYEDLGLITLQEGVELRRVRDRQLDRLLWMWVLAADVDPDAPAVAGLVHHARTTAGLVLHGVQSVHELGTTADGRPMVIVSPAEGISLRDRIRLAHKELGSPLPPAALRSLLRVLVRVCRVLLAAHAQGVVHGGIGPGVIRVTGEGEVWVGRWDRAVRYAGSVREGRIESLPGAWAWGPLHIDPASTPPELVLGWQKQAEESWDVYGLGTVLHEVLTGAPPYRGSSPTAVAAAIREGPPPEPALDPATLAEPGTWDGDTPEVSTDVGQPVWRLDQLRRQCMARDPAARVAGVSEVLAALETWLGETPPRLDSSGPSIEPRPLTWSDGVGQSSGGGAPTPLGAMQAPVQADRYQDLGLIGIGGQAEVRRVHDRTLDRVLAMKIIKAELHAKTGASERFVAEARATARLDHPGVVPVHDIHRLPDGRPFFTMKEVRGRPLRQVMGEVHAASLRGSWGVSPSGWSMRRLLVALQRVCEAVAYAHERGIIHRDLKPANVMVGAFGEVLVMDWGLALALDEGGPPRSLDGRSPAASGVVGTPHYMAPEQARGEVSRFGPTVDVYALGVMLYQVLAGRPPFDDRDPRAVLARLQAGESPPALEDTARKSARLQARKLGLEGEPAAPPIPEGLAQLCRRAMAPDPGDRHPDAKALEADLAAWLEGAERRARAEAVVARARALEPQVEALRSRSEALRRQAAELLAPLPPYAPTRDKRRGWVLEDEALALQRRAELTELEATRLLQGALSHEQDQPEAHALLARRYRAAHAAAEAQRDEAAAQRFEALLRAHDRGQHASYLAGEGRLSLTSRPAGAEVSLYRYVEHERRLVPEPVRALGRTPIDEPLPMGRYLVALRASGCQEVHQPVFITREGHWNTTPPGRQGPLPIVLPAEGELGADEVYVPGGWCLVGGDPHAPGSMPATRVWVDAFVMRRAPVSQGRWRRFLRESGLEATQAGAEAPSPEQWPDDWPAVMMSWHEAVAYAAFAASESGRAWRLPAELEREKAARGVDGRLYPWGDHFDPTWCTIQDSTEGPPRPTPVTAPTLDQSPYGVRGLAGNVREWCADPYRREGPVIVDGRCVLPTLGEAPEAERVIRGGAWSNAARYCRSAFRYGFAPQFRFQSVGLRLVRSL